MNFPLPQKYQLVAALYSGARHKLFPKKAHMQTNYKTSLFLLSEVLGQAHDLTLNLDENSQFNFQSCYFCRFTEKVTEYHHCTYFPQDYIKSQGFLSKREFFTKESNLYFR